MANGKKSKKQQLKDQARDKCLEIQEVRGYLLISPGDYNEGKFCQDLYSVERYLKSLE